MTTPRLRSLTVKGFRAYGAAEQTLNLPGDIAAVWGPNSKGKTSLAEAFEFLLTGSLSRRELMASSQDEFADALRNVHIPAGTEVYVSAKLIAADGTPHEIKRILVSDYAKKQDCQSRLEVDGAKAGENALASFGIVLSQPPLGAPVLAQHTLSYIFSVRPQDRATYFKALLEVTDLDDLRNDIAALASESTPSDAQVLAKFDTCAVILSLNSSVGSLRTTIPHLAATTAKINDGAQALIISAGEPVPHGSEERLATIERILTERRAKTFPVKSFQRAELPGWNAPAATAWSSIDTYLAERKKVAAETRRLVALFDEALKLPPIAAISEPLDCPLCATENGLTIKRVQLIRDHVENTKDFKKAEAAAKATLMQFLASASALIDAAEAVVPQYLQQPAKQRRDAGFTLEKLRSLIDVRAGELVPPWLAQVRPLKKAARRLKKGAQELRTLIEQQMGDLETALDKTALRAAFDLVESLRVVLANAIEAYKTPEQSVRSTLNQILDTQSDTAGWQDFLDIAKQPAALRTALIERKARATVSKELEAALKQIDQAKEQVLDDKFSEYSGSIQDWWERLRPDEQTFFAEVKPRKGARRTIDFKAGLSPNLDRSSPKTRDVIAVFSQSQLHCLGLALFLARAQNEGVGFIILDDPVLSSDEDYRVHFNATVLEALLALPLQVIVLTQDNKTWKEIQIRYRHLGISTAQLYIETPSQGTIIENTSDELLAKINRAASLARGGHPDLRKECGVQLRDAGERFCKEVLIEARRSKGEENPTLSDYDDKSLDWLAPRVDPLLNKDPSHQGKFEVFKNTVNKACHDNAPPGNEEMKQACGEIRYLMKEYLSRQPTAVATQAESVAGNSVLS